MIMRRFLMRFLIALAPLLLVAPLFAQQAQQAKKPGSGAPFAGFGSNSREPIKVDSNTLEVFDKENKAVFSGDVVAVQGQTTMRCTVMNVLYAQAKAEKTGSAPANPAPATGAGGQSSIREIICIGPVSIVSGTQSATSNRLVYEAEKDTVTLTGKVVIADCDNVQRGERVVYDVKTGKATMDAGANGRVQGVFTPASDDRKKSGGDEKECASTGKPAAAPLPLARP